MKFSIGIAAAIALFSCSSANAGVPSWMISESSGRVVILHSGISQIAVRGGTLTAGDIVSTLGNSRAVLVRGGEYLVVSPNSRIKIADPITSGGFTQIIQDFGNTIFRIKKKTTPHFAVETPYLAAVVKGTTFSVTVTDAGTAVQVTEGLVQVSTADGGATHLVRPGDIGLVDAAMPLRLKIEGKEAMVIDSPNKPNATPAPSASIAASATTAFAEEASKNDAAAEPTASPAAEPDVAVAIETKTQPAASSSMFDSVIGSSVSEGPVKLETVSGGLVTGNSALLIAINSSLPVQLVALSDSPPAPVVEVAPIAEVVPAPQAVPAPEATPTIEVAPVAEVALTPSPPVEAPPLVVAGASDPQPASAIAAPPVEAPVVQVAIVDVPAPTVILDPSPTVTVVEVPASTHGNNGNAGGSPSSGSTSSASDTVGNTTNTPSNSGSGKSGTSSAAPVATVTTAPAAAVTTAPITVVATAPVATVTAAPVATVTTAPVAASTTTSVATTSPTTQLSGSNILNFIVEAIKGIRAAYVERNGNLTVPVIPSR